MNDSNSPAATTLEEARRLHALGWACTQVRPREKRPTAKGWQDARFPDDNQLVRWFADGTANVGVRTGKVSGGLVDIDCDSEDFARYLAAVGPDWLRTAPRYRRGGRPHYLHHIEPLPEYTKYSLGKTTIVEVRGDGHQSVVPPSTHPSGECYVWEVPPHQPELRTPEELFEVLSLAITAFVTGTNWTEGQRHEMALALGGWLASIRVPEGVALGIVSAVCLVTGDSEPEGRERDVRDSYRRVEAGLPVTGFETLGERVGEDGRRLLRKLWPATSSSRATAQPGSTMDALADAYVEHEGALFRRVGKDLVPLSNFVARIDEEEIFDDGSPEVRRTFTISGSTSSGTPLGPARVAAREFSSLSWVPEHFGAAAVIAPGPVAKDHLRAAIQAVSTNRRQRTVFGHLGWRDGDDGPVFLHGAGGISATGRHETISVSLPARLVGYGFAPPVTSPSVGVAQSLRLLGVANDRVSFPLYAAMIVPIVLDPVDFIVYLLGETGVGKTVIASLLSQHFGAALDARGLPGSWSSTANSLEVLAFLAKNVLLVVDDFQPSGGLSAVQLNREADRLIRAQGNQAGRSRLRPDGTLIAARFPRGLILSTGEAVPYGDSLRARMLIVRLARGEEAGLDWELVSELQAAAADGVLETATTAFIQWLAPRLHETRVAARAFVAAAQSSSPGGIHRRTPGMFANIEFGLRTWFRFATECDAIDATHEEELLARMSAALDLAAADQQTYRLTQDPVERFFQLLGASVSGGSSHVASAHGGIPSPKHGGRAWGWSGDDYQERPVGRRCIGWVDRESLFLQPEMAYSEAALMARREGHELGIDKSTLARQLDERGLLVTRDHTRQRTTVRRTLAGAQRTVWHVRASSILECGEGAEEP